MRRYYTVIYRVDGEKAEHDAWWQTIQPLFLSDSSGPVSVTTIAAADEVARLNCIEHIVKGSQHRGEKLEAIEAMLVHPDPLESRMIRTRKTRYSASTTHCYAELVLVEMVYSREYARGRNLKTLFRYRAFAGETATYSFETWTQTKLELFSLDPLRSDEPALNELASALRSNLVLFSEFLERGRKTPATTKGKSE